MSITKVTFLLYLRSRGLSSSDIHLLLSVFSFSVIFAEIPTSMIGERLGARNSLIIGTVLKIFVSVLFYFSTSFEALLLTEIISALSVGFVSGSLQTWFLGCLSKTKTDPEVSRMLIVGERVSRVALALGGVSGTFLIKADVNYPWIGVCLGFIVFLILIYILLEGSESKKSKKLFSFACSPYNFAYGFVFQNPMLRFVMLESFLFSFFIASPKAYFLPHLKDVFGRDVTFLGYIWVAIAFSQFLGTFGIEKLYSLFNSTLKLKLVFCLISVIIFIGFSLSNKSVLIFIILYFILEWTKPFHQTLSTTLIKNNSVDAGRITLMSVENQFSKIGNAIALFCAGFFVQSLDLSIVWLIFVMPYVVFILIYRKRFQVSS